MTKYKTFKTFSVSLVQVSVLYHLWKLKYLERIGYMLPRGEQMSKFTKRMLIIFFRVWNTAKSFFYVLVNFWAIFHFFLSFASWVILSFWVWILTHFSVLGGTCNFGSGEHPCQRNACVPLWVIHTYLNIYLLKVSNSNTREMCKTSSKF